MLVPEKIFLMGSYHIWAWRPTCSCDLEAEKKLSFPLHNRGATQNLPLIGHMVSEKKMFEECEWTTGHGYNIYLAVS